MTSDIDSTTRLQLAEHVEKLTTSGKAELDQDILKKIKAICKSSDSYVSHAYHLLMHQLEKEHAEIRYSVLLTCDELFRRSHRFRELLVSDFQTFMELTVDIDPEQPLPNPVQVAKRLKCKALECIHQWYDAYSGGYQKLKLGYIFLQDCKKIDFRNIQTSGVIEQRRDEEKKTRQDILNNEKMQKCLAEMKELMPEIESCLKQMEECCKLLLPQEIFSDIDFENPKPCCSKDLEYYNDKTISNIDDEMTVNRDFCEPEDEDWRRQHGISNTDYNLTIEVKPEKLKINANSDNTVILRTLQENFKIITKKYSPCIAKWLKAVIKGSGPVDEVKKIIDLKNNVSDMLKKCETLGITDIKLISDDSSDDGSEFEEVEAKDGFEPTIPQHLRKEYGLQPLENPCDQIIKMTANDWKPGHGDSTVDEMQDPTSAACTLRHLEAKINSSELHELIKSKRTATGLMSNRSDVPEDKAKEISKAPKLRYDTDLINWGEQREVTTSILKFDSLHRFWQPVHNETQEILKSKEETAALNSRVMEFSGKFAPVKWQCRTPLPSGKLCPRRDRYKCPLHGSVIPRDSSGNPSREEDKLRLQKEQEEYQRANPDWQDPSLLRDIQAATGIDLTIKRKQKKGTKKGKPKFPGLTDLNAHQSTSRTRLEKKVFDKSAIKRVAQTLDNLDYKKFKDKFGNQFNYSYET